ncbi:MAG TPA: hypothetical protein VN089_26830 [Duganella sp.]|nr:hypothetical protein [Duganella sp.]
MTLNVTIFFDDNTPIEPGVNLQLLDGATVVASATTGANGVAAFNVDPTSLRAAAVTLSPQQTPPAFRNRAN